MREVRQFTSAERVEGRWRIILLEVSQVLAALLVTELM
jgi:hypothetical protein